MPMRMLKIVRFVVPAAMIYFCMVLFCWTSAWCSLSMPESYEFFSKSIASIVLGSIYYSIPLREHANRVYYERVNNNLVAQLTAPFCGDPGFPKNLRWPHVRTVFYNFVDSDKALARISHTMLT
jgi:hypothetical protein